MAHRRRCATTGLRSFLLMAVTLSVAPAVTWADNQPSPSMPPPAPAIQSAPNRSDTAKILNLLQEIRKGSRPREIYATVRYPPPDPSNEHLQQLVKALKKIDPYLQETLYYNFQYDGPPTSLDKAIALDVLRYLHPPREIALPYYEREVKTLSAHDYYLMETVVRGMLLFGGPNPESRIPIVDRLETKAEFIRERAMQEFRALPAPKQETIITALRKRWAEPTYKQGDETAWPADTLLRLASQREAERLASLLQPNTILISCSNCDENREKRIDKERRIDYVFLVQSANVTLDNRTYTPEYAKQFGLYTVEITGFELAIGAPLDPSGKHFLDQTVHCHLTSETETEDGTRNDPDRPTTRLLTHYETPALYALPSIRATGAPKWIGAPWTVGNPTTPAVLPFSERDRNKLAACEQLRHEVLPTSQSVLASIGKAGGTIISDHDEYGTPAKLAPNSDQFFGAVGPAETTTEMHIQSNTVTPQGLKTLEGFCRSKGPSFSITSFSNTGHATCHKLVKKDDSYEYILSVTLSGAITEAALHWSDMLLSRKPLPPQTWRTRPPSPEEQRLANEQGNRHSGALGRLDPTTYNFTVIEAKDGRQVIILPVYTNQWGDSSATVYLVLTKQQEEWKTLYGVEQQSLNDLLLDIDGDGFPEMLGSSGYQSAAIWKLLPHFTRLFQRLGG